MIEVTCSKIYGDGTYFERKRAIQKGMFWKRWSTDKTYKKNETIKHLIFCIPVGFPSSTSRRSSSCSRDMLKNISRWDIIYLEKNESSIKGCFGNLGPSLKRYFWKTGPPMMGYCNDCVVLFHLQAEDNLTVVEETRSKMILLIWSLSTKIFLDFIPLNKKYYDFAPLRRKCFWVLSHSMQKCFDFTPPTNIFLEIIPFSEKMFWFKSLRLFFF